MSSERLDISYVSILRVLTVLAAILFLYFIRDVLAILFVAVFLTAAITPWVNWFQKRGIPNGLAVLVIYVGALALVSLVIVLIIPPLTDQINQLARSFPEYFQQLIQSFSGLQVVEGQSIAQSIRTSLGSVQQSLSTATQGVFSVLASIFGSIVFFIAVLVITFYMVINEELFIKTIQQFTPKKYSNYVVQFIKRVQEKLGRWLRGQLLLMFFIFVITYVVLLIIGVKFALVLALIAGILELIPFVGPILSAIPAIIIALSQSPLLAVLVIVAYFLIQQVENNLLVPKIMQKAVGLNPIITIIVILIGAKLGGIVGAILAVPVATVLSMLLSDWQESRNKRPAAGPT
jgi:predicted PurR-regulated permease PerM